MRSLIVNKLHCLESQTDTLSKKRSELSPSMKRRKKSLVSVIFLTWERDSYIEDTIQSFKSFIKKTEMNIDFEMVSFDNGSSNPNIDKILSKHTWDIRIKSPNNLGISKGLEKAFASTNGEFMICLEDDWQTIATRSLFAQSIRIMREFDDIGGVRHREAIQNCIINKTEINVDQLMIEFGKKDMDNMHIPWRGKYGRRRWFDERVTSAGDKFYTWTNPDHFVPSVYCNPCFMFRGEAFDRIQPMISEYSYSRIFGSYYNAAILIDEPKFVHKGEKRYTGRWHE